MNKSPKMWMNMIPLLIIHEIKLHLYLVQDVLHASDHDQNTDLNAEQHSI